MFTFIKSAFGRTAARYLFAAAVSAVFSAVYEAFSHGVYSAFMIWMFLWPLLGGAIPFGILARCRRLPKPPRRSRCLYHSGIATLTVGSCMTGIFEIYGTTSGYVAVYWVAGFALAIAGLLCYAWTCAVRRAAYSSRVNE